MTALFPSKKRRKVTVEQYRRMVEATIQYWAEKIKPLESRLRALEGKTVSGSNRISEVRRLTAKLNSAYESLFSNLRLIPIPSRSTKSTHWTKKIRWPAYVPQDVRRVVLRSIQQGGLSVRERVTLKPVKIGKDGYGVAVDFGKW